MTTSLVPTLAERPHNYVRYWQTLRGIFNLVRDSDSSTSVYDIEDSLRDHRASQVAVAHLMSVPEIRQLCEERYLHPLPDLAQLRSCPPASLGHVYCLHLERNGFDAEHYRTIEVRNDGQYLAMRMRQTHDIWHVVAGIGVDPIGELGLKALELAQTRRPMAAVLTAGGLLRYLFKEPERLGELLRALSHGYEIGESAAPLLAQRWEERWSDNVRDLRRELGVRAGSYLSDLIE